MKRSKERIEEEKKSLFDENPNIIVARFFVSKDTDLFQQGNDSHQT